MNDPSPETPEDDVRLSVGVIVAPQGVNGQVRMQCWTQFPEHLTDLDSAYLDDEPEPRRIHTIRLQGNLAILTVEGVTTRDDAEQLRGAVVRIPLEEAAPLAEDEYYHFQLIGLHVFDESGRSLGWLAEIIETGAHDVYVVRNESGREELFPALKNVVLDIDLDQGRMVVRPLKYEE